MDQNDNRPSSSWSNQDDIPSFLQEVPLVLVQQVDQPLMKIDTVYRSDPHIMDHYQKVEELEEVKRAAESKAQEARHDQHSFRATLEDEEEEGMTTDDDIDDSDFLPGNYHQLCHSVSREALASKSASWYYWMANHMKIVMYLPDKTYIDFSKLSLFQLRTCVKIIYLRMARSEQQLSSDLTKHKVFLVWLLNQTNPQASVMIKTIQHFLGLLFLEVQGSVDVGRVPEYEHKPMALKEVLDLQVLILKDIKVPIGQLAGRLVYLPEELRFFAATPGIVSLPDGAIEDQIKAQGGPRFLVRQFPPFIGTAGKEHPPFISILVEINQRMEKTGQVVLVEQINKKVDADFFVGQLKWIQCRPIPSDRIPCIPQVVHVESEDEYNQSVLAQESTSTPSTK